MRRLALIAVALAMAACSGPAPTSPLPGGPPVPAAASFEGVWNFKYRIEQCGGDRNCFAYLGDTSDFSVRLMRAAGAYVGVVMLPGANVDVTGVVDANGTLVLAGVRPAAAQYDARVEVTRLALRHDAGTITGDLEINAQRSFLTFYGPWRRGGPIVSATKTGEISDSPISDLTGTWTGSIVTRDCSSTGSSSCSPLRPEEVWDFELTIGSMGSAVMALLAKPAKVTLEGSLSGSAVVVRGVAEERNSAHTSVWTVRPSTLTRDAVGRLRGSLSMEWRRTYTVTGDIVITDFRVIELVDVALRPPS